MSDELKKIQYRMKAIYHNCHTAASFSRAAATEAENPLEKDGLIKVAQAYEHIACWLKANFNFGVVDHG